LWWKITEVRTCRRMFGEWFGAGPRGGKVLAGKVSAHDWAAGFA
jgi:hypothetical protein